MRISKAKPPRLGQWILKKILPSEERRYLIEGIEERYLRELKDRGWISALFWYFKDISITIPLLIFDNFTGSIILFKNYLKINLRNVKKNKLFSIINITGLAIGMTCFILISHWIMHELSYDTFHENADELCLVATHMKYGDTEFHDSVCPPLVGPTLKEEYPEILNSVRIFDDISLVFSYGEKEIIEDVTLADPTILNIFHFPLLSGDPATALSQPNSLVITEEMAEKYFGEENPINKTVQLGNRYLFTVKGVMKNIPSNSSIKFNFLMPIEFAETNRKGYLNQWVNYAFWTYVQLAENVSHKDLSLKIAGRIKQSEPEYDTELFLRPFTKYHLYNLGFGGGAIEQVRLFSIIALFILIISCINFINLSTARSSTRSGEVGIRKVIGAVRLNIIFQFIGESITLSFISSLLALVFANFLLPIFNHLTSQDLKFNISALLPVVIGVIIFTGVLGGSYPALSMSSFQPVDMLKGSRGKGGRRIHFRKIFVMMQFAISIVLIIGTTIISRQMGYIKKRDLGFDKEHLICIPVSGALRQNLTAAKHEMLQHPNVLTLSSTTLKPTQISWRETGWQWQGRLSDTEPIIAMMQADFNFLETFDMDMAEGMFFSEQNVKGSTNNIIINETFAKMMDLDNPIGTRASFRNNNYIVTGIIRDFNFMPLYSEIEPLVIFYNPGGSYIYLRILPQNIPRTISHMERVHKKFNPGIPFVYSFFDEEYNRIYRTDQRLSAIFRYFAALAIFISCLGIFGLAACTAERRTKEIGIRKVLGASVPGIVFNLSKEFASCVLVANIIAWPIAYFVMNKWLQNFAYRISINIWILAFSAALALFIAFLTITYHSIKAATANPVDSLRYE